MTDDKSIIQPCPHCGARRGWDCWCDCAVTHWHWMGLYTPSDHPWWHEERGRIHTRVFTCRACGEAVT